MSESTAHRGVRMGQHRSRPCCERLQPRTQPCMRLTVSRRRAHVGAARMTTSASLATNTAAASKCRTSLTCEGVGGGGG